MAMAGHVVPITITRYYICWLFPGETVVQCESLEMTDAGPDDTHIEDYLKGKDCPGAQAFWFENRVDMRGEIQYADNMYRIHSPGGAVNVTGMTEPEYTAFRSQCIPVYSSFDGTLGRVNDWSGNVSYTYKAKRQFCAGDEAAGDVNSDSGASGSSGITAGVLSTLFVTATAVLV